MDIKEVVKTAILRNSHEWGDEQAEAVLKAINEAGFLVVPAKAQAVPSGFILVEKTDLECAIDALKWASNEDGDLCAKQAAMLESAIKAQVVSGWISVKDKLPPANILVLGMSQTRSNIFNVYNVMALDEFEEAEVTHWMPLPDAPQEPAND